MSNDRWLKKDGTRWNDADRTRVAALFRHHVDTPANRKEGRSCRIRREPCYFCVEEKRGSPSFDLSWLPLAPFHHVDYTKPFRGVWCCNKHHRAIDHGTLVVPLRAVRDYTSDIDVLAYHSVRGARPRECADELSPTGTDVPF